MLKPYLERLEGIKAVIKDAGDVIKDELLGKLYGTMGQNYAFMAPFRRSIL